VRRAMDIESIAMLTEYKLLCDERE
jgi:hypothetical protein